MTFVPFNYTTKPRRIANGDIVTARVEYSQLRGNAHPHFSISGHVYGPALIRGEDCIFFADKRYWCHSAGQCIKEIVEAFPELVPYMKWHLCGPDGSMYYKDNAVYWHKLWGDSIAGPPWSEDKVVLEYGTATLRDYFCSTCVFTPGEADLEEIVCWDEQELTQWLEARLPRLQSEFMEAMQQVSELKL